MSRRTFPRAAAAGLLAAALGTTSPAPAQAPNPWRGETATPTVTAAPKPSRQVVIGVGYNQIGGLTGSVQFRTLAAVPAMPLVPTPRETTAARPVCVDLDIVPGSCPCPTQFTAQRIDPAAPTEITYSIGEPSVVNTLKPLVAAAQPFQVVSRSPLKPAVAASLPVVHPASAIIRASYAVPVTTSPLRFMPPPAPLPLPRAIPAVPQADALIPLQIEFAFPEKGVRPVWTPGSNAVPHGQPQLLESILPIAIPAAQGRE